MTLRYSGLAWMLALALALVACATPRQDAIPAGVQRDHWAGRMSVRVESDPVQSFSASFELRGSAAQGQLALYSPIGSTVAEMHWSNTPAHLRTADGKRLTFESLDALTRQAIGTELPVASIFSWLSGLQADTGGWVADLQEHARGRLIARRLQPAPAVEMRLILDQTTP